MADMDVRRAVNERVSRSGLKGGVPGRVRCEGEVRTVPFEERFYDPDHPKDSDWVADVDYEKLFSHLMGRRFPSRAVRP